jgi:hypothetical protein
VTSVTSYVTSFTALGLMLSTLAYAPFSHVHSEQGHHGAGDTRGSQVHSHFSFADQGREETDEPLIDVPSHEGHHVDLFLSLVGEPFPVAESTQSHADVTPLLQISERQGAWRPDRTRDPPAASLSSRPPPV